jgi:flagellar assembly protein FliH
MRWFDESNGRAKSAKFREVSRSKKRPDLSWTGLPNREGMSLRPPRVPNIPAETSELEEVSGLHFAPDAPGLASVRPPPSIIPPQESQVRRPDTVIDEIVPRAEEEAFVAIRDAVVQAQAVREKQFADSEQRLVDLAILVARRVIAKELSLDPGLVRGLVQEGIAALSEQDGLVVRVGTFFAETRDELEAQLEGAKVRCEVVVDPSLGLSGCVVETELGSVDESVEVRIENMLESLTFDAPRKPRRK